MSFKVFALTGRVAKCFIPRALPWAKSFCPFRACCNGLLAFISIKKHSHFLRIYPFSTVFFSLSFAFVFASFAPMFVAFAVMFVAFAVMIVAFAPMFVAFAPTFVAFAVMIVAFAPTTKFA